MPASAEVQQVARRVAVGSALAAAAVLLAVLSSVHLNGQSASGHSAAAALGTQSSLSQLRSTRPVLSSLALTSALDAAYCDCSAASKCVEIIETDFKKKFPGGGAAGLGGRDWGSYDPVTVLANPVHTLHHTAPH